MKTAALILLVSVFFSGTLPFEKEGIQTKHSIKDKDNSDRYLQIRTFVFKNIINQIQEVDSSEISMYAFSRCPSGYQYSLSEGCDYMDDELIGKIKFWDGCHSKDVCEFRINLQNETAEVRDLGSLSYFNVPEWVLNTSNDLNFAQKSQQTKIQKED